MSSNFILPIYRTKLHPTRSRHKPKKMADANGKKTAASYQQTQTNSSLIFSNTTGITQDRPQPPQDEVPKANDAVTDSEISDFTKGATPAMNVSKMIGNLLPSGNKSIGLYIKDLSNINNAMDFFDINERIIGSRYLNIDKVATGLLFGFCSGYAVRRALRAGALLFGVGFISLQTMNYLGYVSVDWNRINKQMTDTLDVNKDGKIDKEDFHMAREKLLTVLKFGLPGAGGFGAGFFWGLHSQWP